MKKCFLTKARPQTRMLGRTGLAVSCVGHRCAPDGSRTAEPATDEGASVICDALRRGINFIDTAQYYRTYPYIRRALEVMRLVTEENPRGADQSVYGGKSMRRGCSCFFRKPLRRDCLCSFGKPLRCGFSCYARQNGRVGKG